ncbi:MAG: sensor histidine kinase [Alphaproteobacteria bacterium]
MAECSNQTNAELKEFSYIISHDLSASIRQLCCFSKLLADSMGGNLSEEQKQYLEFISQISYKAERMLNAVTHYSDIITKEFVSSKTELNQVAKSAISQHKDLIKSCGGEVKCDILPTTVCDKILLTEVFYLLIDNALKFRSPDRLLEIHIGVEDLGDHKKIYVKDNGIGFDPKKTDIALSLFRSVEKNNSLGTGLAFAKKIIERHNGEVFLETKPDEGTKVSFTLQI